MNVQADKTQPLVSTDDIVQVRRAVREMAVEIGFSLVDQTKLVTAASELARNAVIYGGGGTVKIEILRDDRRTGLRLTFTDQGPGIPPQDRKRIFDMFVTTRPGGTGLGLFLARTAVENEGGTLVAQTPPSGRGACLRVTLPLEKKGPA